MIKINEKLLTKYNFSSRNGEKIKYIVIHDTGNTGHKANADAHFNYFNSQDRRSSAHYFTDDTQILRIIKDEDESWAVGDGKGKYGITNENSINIEMCINSDGDFTKTYKNTIDLVKHLMDKYSIPIDRVVRHYDASRKLCPNIWKENNWERWNKFKMDLINDKDYKDFITKVYKNVLQREPDEEGLNFWNDKLKNGLTYDEFMKEIACTEEFKEKYL